MVTLILYSIRKVATQIGRGAPTLLGVIRVCYKFFWNSVFRKLHRLRSLQDIHYHQIKTHCRRNKLNSD